MSSFLDRTNLSFPLLSLLVAILAWLFWVIAARSAPSEDIGLAASILSVATVFTAFAMIGIEYPLLKNSLRSKSYFGSALVIELVVHLSLIPILIFSLDNYSDSLIFLGIIIMFLGLVLIPRYCLLGVLAIKQVIVFDLVSAILRISLLIMFLTLNFGANGILLSIIVQSIIVTPFLFLYSIKKFGFKIKKQVLFSLLKEGLANFPSKISLVLQFTGVIVILVFLGFSNEAIAGIILAFAFFRLILLIPEGFATLAIPTSSLEGKDQSPTSVKIGMSIASPFIVLSIIVPELILSVYDTQYVKFSEVLYLLGFALIPAILTTNVRSFLNNTSKFKQLSVLGIVEGVIIVLILVLFAKTLGNNVASYAILFGFFTSGIIAFILATNNIRRIFLLCSLSIALGIISGYLVNQVIPNDYVIGIVGPVITIISLFLLRVITKADVLYLIDRLKS